MLLDQLVQALRLGIVGGSLVPFDEKLLTLCFREQRQSRNCSCRIRQGCSQKMDVIPGNALDRAALEAGSIVVKLEFKLGSTPYRNQSQLVALADYMHPFQREAYAIKYLFGAQLLVREAD